MDFGSDRNFGFVLADLDGVSQVAFREVCSALQLSGWLPVLPSTLMCSKRNFSKLAMSMILSLTGLLQSITKVLTFFFETPLATAGRFTDGILMAANLTILKPSQV